MSRSSSFFIWSGFGGSPAFHRSLRWRDRLLLTTLVIPLLLLLLPLVALFLIRNVRLMKRAQNHTTPLTEDAEGIVIDIKAAERSLPPRS
jgi:hypothetical protein